jgi:type I restriction enzyme S subunit
MSTVEGWKKESLSRVAQINMGQSPDSKYYSEEKNGLPFLQGCAEFTGRFPKNVLYCSQTKKVALAGSILFSVRAPVGKINVADQDYIIGRGLAAISGVDVDQTYLEHYLKYEASSFRNASQGSTFEAINSSELNKWPIEYPTSKPEQAKIAEILSTVDRAIEQTEALIAKQQRIKTGLMQDLLTRGIDEHGNLRTEQTHKFKDSPLSRIPVEWEVQPCAVLCLEIIVGIVIRPAQYYRPDGVPVLRSANVRENRITTEDIVFMSERDNEALSKSRLAKGDMVTVRTGYPGTTAVIPSELDGSNCVDIVISRPNREKVRSEFLSIWVNSDRGKRQVLEGQGGLAQQHFNVGEMRTLLVKVPDISEQERIVNLLIMQNSAIDDLAKNQHKLCTIKTALMQDLLTGKRRVTEILKIATSD